MPLVTAVVAPIRSVGYWPEIVHECLVSIRADQAAARDVIDPMRKGGTAFVNVWGATSGEPDRTTIRLIAFTADPDEAKDEAETLMDDLARMGYPARLDGVRSGPESDIVG